MARVDITLNGRAYALACEDGQEPRLRELAGYVDGKLAEITGETAGGSEAQLLVLTTLVLADEIFDLQQDLEGLRRAREMARPDPAAIAAAAAAAAAATADATAAEEERMAAALESLAQRIEDIAQRIERA
ncbi:MAG: hypothetical protein RLY86_4187 [Pseudomonadota bacterium]